MGLALANGVWAELTLPVLSLGLKMCVCSLLGISATPMEEAAAFQPPPTMSTHGADMDPPTQGAKLSWTDCLM